MFGALTLCFASLSEEVSVIRRGKGHPYISFYGKRSCLKPFPIWNIIKLQDQMSFLLSFIKSSGQSLKIDLMSMFIQLKD
jgi:hypothetical protein